jgi:hypothetical protein
MPAFPSRPIARAIRLVAISACASVLACTYNFDGLIAIPDAPSGADAVFAGAGGTADTGTQQGGAGGKTAIDGQGGVATTTLASGGQWTSDAATTATGGQAGTDVAAASGGQGNVDAPTSATGGQGNVDAVIAATGGRGNVDAGIAATGGRSGTDAATTVTDVQVDADAATTSDGQAHLDAATTATDVQVDAQAAETAMDGQADADATTTGSTDTASCVGPTRGGICWYLGPQGSSCQQVCTSHGALAPAMASHVGTTIQGGSLAECSVLLGLLGISGTPANGTRSDGLGLGCHFYQGATLWWLSSPNFSATASQSSSRLVCGCTK